MSPFDPYFTKLRKYLRALALQGRLIRELARAGAGRRGLPLRLGGGEGGGIVLREDTFVELGHPDAGSCSLLLWTESRAFLRDGAITLVGPDIPESAGESLPFGQVLLAGGEDLTTSFQAALERSQYVGDRIEGYMMRSVPERVWSRVSKQAAAGGFCFQTLGGALMALLRTEVPQVQAAEAVLVTSSAEDLAPLQAMAEQARKIARGIKAEQLVARADGELECTREDECPVCADKPVCDGIREILVLRKSEVGGKAATRDD